MSLRPKLDLRQSQSLVMTPQLQQAIKLLQMSNLELNDYVDAELERNPLLEREDDRDDEFGPEPRERDGDDDLGDGDTGDVDMGYGDAGDVSDTGLELGTDSGTSQSLEQLDVDLDTVYSDESPADLATRGPEGTPDSNWSTLSPSQGGQSFDGPGFDLESTLTREATLAEHLTEQLHLAIKDPAQRLIGAHLIGMVNELGYLAGDTAEVAERLGTSEQAVLATLYELQRFDPAGVFARDLAECLALQLYEKDRLDPAMKILVENLELLARHDFTALRRLCNVDEEDLFEMVAEIRNLNPKPGNAFGAVVVQPVVPDVFVREGNDGGWVVELNSETLPRVLVNNAYHATVSRSATRDEDKTYISECYANANWLARSLDQRARTILKVSRELVRQQDAFLVWGIEHLRPLNLRTIADAIEMHESTVSRVTANKYLATPRGIFEMKYFFTSAIGSSEGGEAHAAESVRHRIKELIDAENTANVLSDDKIVDILRETGIDIARRTVAKYREALGIPSSVQRRRAKRAMR